MTRHRKSCYVPNCTLCALRTQRLLKWIKGLLEKEPVMVHSLCEGCCNRSGEESSCTLRHLFKEDVNRIERDAMELSLYGRDVPSAEMLMEVIADEERCARLLMNMTPVGTAHTSPEST